MALIQTTTVLTGGAVNNTPFLTGIAPGNLLVLFVAYAQTTNGAPPTVQGWTAAENPTATSSPGIGIFCGAAIFYREASKDTVVKATIIPGAGSGSASISSCMAEFTFNESATSLDKHTNNGADTSTSGNTGTTATTSIAGELVVALIGIADVTGAPHANSGLTDPATSGYSTVAVNQNSNNGLAFQASYKEVSATGTQTASWTWTDSSAYQAVIATFIQAPRIDTFPVTTYVAEGQTATFTVAATTSSGSLTYQWKDDGGNVGTNSNSYTTGTLTTADSGSIITVDVSDSNGTFTTFDAYLWVEPATQISWTGA